MAFLFYIDGQLTDQPDSDKELLTNIKRDSDMGALLVTQNVSLRYSQNLNLEINTISGYTYLNDLFSGGFCDEADILIMDQVSPTLTYEIYRGVIKVPSMEFDEQRISVTTKIQDNSFYSYINNNKNVEFNLRSTNTKSKQLIDPVPIYDVDFFLPATGTYGSGFGYLFRGYRVYDIFKFLVGALSDNKVGFESNYLQQVSIWDQKELFVFDGLALVDENTDPTMSMSFQELFNEIFKARNISFYIDMSVPESPVLRLENIGFFFNQSTVYQFTDIKDLVTTFKTTKLYGTINVGSEYTIGGDRPPYYFPEAISYFGFKKETYTPIGQCNTDNVLDLINKFIISSNAIADQAVGVIDLNLDEKFLVECESVNEITLEALASRYPGYNSVPPYFYNLGLTNAKRLPIHGSNFQSAVNNTLEIDGNGFRASLGTEVLLGTQSAGNPQSFTGFGIPVDVDPIIFPDEFGGNNFDGGNNYNNISGYYQAPTDGAYSFTAKLDLLIENLKVCPTATVTVISSPTVAAGTYLNTPVYYGFIVTSRIDVYTDNTFAVLKDSQTQVLSTFLNGSPVMNINIATQMTAGNVARVRSQVAFYRFAPALFTIPMDSSFGIVATTNCVYGSSEPKAAIYIEDTSFFECNGTPEGAITTASNDPDLYKILQHRFDYDISVSDFQRILANPIGLFPFEKDGVTRNGWIEEMNHNNFTGLTNVTLITSNAIIP